MICERCLEWTPTMMGSRFNTQMCCLKCLEVEKSHPKYQEACDAEAEAVRNGDYNFKGVGLPAELEKISR